MKTRNMKISDINVGDHVVAYSTVFEITSKRSRIDDSPGGSGLAVYSLKTKVIDGSKSVLPADWMDTWVIQSNDRATHSVVCPGHKDVLISFDALLNGNVVEATS